ncbi:deoxyribodipyrimidine photo-lyase [Candidatus Caldarchaeum subterraneum]|uniref:Deoxyribodipyrimidine photo-lyase n=1 Tax=Caldiarchaeum subterraneum TaxID=311458 RepID=E6PAU3_CALS0|nr:deoxyribodipyrimidine photo-lyase [Candidatus Caldarchaeum subterraneum]
MEYFPDFLRPERVTSLAQAALDKRGEYLVYVMDASLRAYGNHALEYAVFEANRLGRSLVVVYNLDEKQPFMNTRKLHFIHGALKKVDERLSRRGILFLVRKTESLLKLVNEAVSVVVDAGYTGHQQTFRKTLAKYCDSVKMVEGDVVVPVKTASTRAEPYARTIRPKLLNKLDNFLETVPEIPVKQSSTDLDIEGLRYETFEHLLKDFGSIEFVEPVKDVVGGEDEAHKRLETFVGERLDRYAAERSDPGSEACSELSPYLRYGMISPVQVLKRVFEYRRRGDVNVESLINELVVWRELARNGEVYNPFFEKYEGLPEWARETLSIHAGDRREQVYSMSELERADTHDVYWNAAQQELLATGKIHNYMRMYWCKKLLEWTDSPETAYRYAVYLNNKYGLDAEDPNSYLGISWCFGAYDRPFTESKIYGKVRRMTDQSLKRKKQINNYIQRWSAPAGI